MDCSFACKSKRERESDQNFRLRAEQGPRVYLWTGLKAALLSPLFSRHNLNLGFHSCVTAGRPLLSPVQPAHPSSRLSPFPSPSLSASFLQPIPVALLPHLEACLAPLQLDRLHLPRVSQPCIQAPLAPSHTFALPPSHRGACVFRLSCCSFVPPFPGPRRRRRRHR